jgi:hypothetical protein
MPYFKPITPGRLRHMGARGEHQVEKIHRKRYITSITLVHGIFFPDSTFVAICKRADSLFGFSGGSKYFGLMTVLLGVSLT